MVSFTIVVKASDLAFFLDFCLVDFLQVSNTELRIIPSKPLVFKSRMGS